MKKLKHVAFQKFALSRSYRPPELLVVEAKVHARKTGFFKRRNL